MNNKPHLCLDFDGVCHSYTSGWQGAAEIPDPPVEGLFEFIVEAQPHFIIEVFSLRSNELEGREAMRKWFGYHFQKWREAGHEEVEALHVFFPSQKPLVTVGLDDRILTFTGKFPTVDVLLNFKPWTKKQPGF